jgi:uncharacterized delta-60 repeat protein
MFRIQTPLRNAASRRRARFQVHAENLEGRLLLTAGDLDLTFGTGGYAITQAPAPKNGIPGDRATAVQIQTDGKILAAGYARAATGFWDLELIRLTAGGALDPSFGSGGRVLLKGPAGDMALQPDGKIVVVGSVTITTGKGRNTVQQNDVVVMRLLANGALDTSFGQGGKVLTGISTAGDMNDSAVAVALQLDGKIVVGGSTQGGTASGVDSLLLRYNANGTLDTTFGQGGKVVTAWSAGEDRLGDVAIQPDGRIVVAGKGYLNTAGNNFNPYFVARYNANGSLDSGSGGDATPGDGFGTGGVAATPFGSPNFYTGALALQGDGGIVFAGFSFNGTDRDLALARFTTTGGLDPTFGGTGGVTLDLGGDQSAYAVAVRADGKLVVAGNSDVATSAYPEALVARFAADGTPDATFGSGGVAINSFSTGQDEFADVAIQADGKIVAVGSIDPPTGGAAQPSFLMARFLGDPAPSLSAAALPTRSSAMLAGTPDRLRHVDLALAGLGDATSTDSRLPIEALRGPRRKAGLRAGR